MASDKENAQSFGPPTSRPRPPPSSLVFPPLPPLSPPDADDNSWLRKTSPPPPPESTAPWRQSSRRFGVKITNVLDADTAVSSGDKTGNKPPTANVMEPSPRHYQQQQQQQYQHLPQHLGLKASRVMKKGDDEADISADRTMGRPSTKRNNASNAGEGELPEPFPRSPPTPKAKGLEKDTSQFGRTIWSVTPEELSALEEEMISLEARAAEPAKKLSYAEASKRNLPGFVENHVGQTKTVVEVERPRRTFKKYYGLPVFIPPGPEQNDVEEHEEKETPPAIGLSPSLRSEPSDVLGYTQNFALSAHTPTFYPRQTTDTSELIQMLKVSLSSKKIAPHMDWWPGDWKCTNCGNHVWQQPYHLQAILRLKFAPAISTHCLLQDARYSSSTAHKKQHSWSNHCSSFLFITNREFN
ncbi:hypothetical protein PF011_g22356 [Phytophthora fragariae]|uniref:Uncharacterized protein n=1 Tax=Phytophthora fragariae TaxID=53985 RepID=A0A6A3ICC0_9STRA|nr:hypothetical protein PF011_g22356 [Phytophthora fragariae]